MYRPLLILAPRRRRTVTKPLNFSNWTVCLCQSVLQAGRVICITKCTFCLCLCCTFCFYLCCTFCLYLCCTSCLYLCYWLRYCATSRKVAAFVPNRAMGFSNDLIFLWPWGRWGYLLPGGGVQRWPVRRADSFGTFMCRLSKSSRSLGLLETSGPAQVCIGTALPLGSREQPSGS